MFTILNILNMELGILATHDMLTNGRVSSHLSLPPCRVNPVRIYFKIGEAMMIGFLQDTAYLGILKVVVSVVEHALNSSAVCVAMLNVYSLCKKEQFG